MASQWHYLTDDSDEPQGPVSSEQLRKLAAAGKLARDDMMALVSGLAISVCGATGGIMGLVAFIKR